MAHEIDSKVTSDTSSLGPLLMLLLTLPILAVAYSYKVASLHLLTLIILTHSHLYVLPYSLLQN